VRFFITIMIMISVMIMIMVTIMFRFRLRYDYGFDFGYVMVPKNYVLVSKHYASFSNHYVSFSKHYVSFSKCYVMNKLCFKNLYVMITLWLRVINVFFGQLFYFVRSTVYIALTILVIYSFSNISIKQLIDITVTEK